MKKETYLEKRNSLLDQAKEAVTAGDIEKSAALRQEIEKLDADFENASKEMANLEAMAGAPVVNMPVTGLKDSMGAETVTGEEDMENAYREAFAMSMMGKNITNEQKDVIAAYNKDKNLLNEVNTTEGNAMLVPKSIIGKIWETANGGHPILRDITPTHVPGDVAIIVDDENDTDGEWVDEETKSSEGELKFREVRLTGCELAKGIQVSWKLKKMAIGEFLDYLAKKIGKKMGNALAAGYITGKGKPGNDDTFKPQALGIITELEAEANTPQVLSYTGELAYKDITAMLGLITTGNATKFYASHQTIWNRLANIKDENGKPIFIPNPEAGGVGRMFGRIVEREDAVPEGSLVAGDTEYYAANINEDVAMHQEDMVKERQTYYMGYTIIDGAPLSTKAFAYAKPEADAGQQTRVAAKAAKA